MKKTISVIAALIAIVIVAATASVFVTMSVGENYEVPTVTSIENNDGAVELTWEPVGGKNYSLFKWGEAENDWILLTKENALGYTDNNVKSGEMYYYYVSSRKGLKKLHSDVVGITYVSPPAAKEVKCVADGLEVLWDEVPGAEKYIVCRENGEGKFKDIGQTNETAFVDKNVKDGIEYKYALRAVSAGYESSQSVQSVSGALLERPRLIYVRNSPKGVTIKWNKNNAAQSYKIQRKVSEKWKTVGIVTSEKNTFVDKKASFGKKNIYRVRALSGEASSGYSNKMSVLALDPKKPAVALTWDDGPYSPVTNQILDTLKKYHARATFFIVGSRAEMYKDCIKREVKLGCEVATHTYSHANLTRLSKKEIRKEIKDGVRAVEKYSGKGTVKVIRTPGGAVNDKVRASVKYPMINWSVDTLDWKYRDKKSVIKRLKESVNDGSIVLMHDLYVSTGDAAVKIIPWLVKHGYQLVTVSELFELKGINAKAGELYTHG